MKNFSPLIIALVSASNFAAADNTGINMLRGILPKLNKKMRDDVSVNLADDEEGEEVTNVVEPMNDVFSSVVCGDNMHTEYTCCAVSDCEEHTPLDGYHWACSTGSSGCGNCKLCQN